METKHPLFDREIKSIRSWKEWKEAWSSTNQFEYLHSLLHSGFEISIGLERNFSDHEDRILSYLAVAEGHVDNALEYEHPMRKLATKAFKVLCTNYFKSTAARNITYSLDRTSLRELRIHEAILHFFRPVDRLDTNGELKLKNLQDLLGHNESIVADFLSELIRLCWNHRIGWHDPLIVDHTPLRKHRPRYVEILTGLDRLDMLLSRKAPNLDLIMDETSMDKLRELGVKPWPLRDAGGSFTSPRSVNHAASIGSRAAQTYVVLQGMRAQKRQDRCGVD